MNDRAHVIWARQVFVFTSGRTSRGKILSYTFNIDPSEYKYNNWTQKIIKRLPTTVPDRDYLNVGMVFAGKNPANRMRHAQTS